MNDSSKINAIRTVLFSKDEAVEQTEVKMATATLESGTVLEADAFEEGNVAMIVSEEDRIPAPAGEHKSDIGTIVVGEDGVIIEVRTEEAEEETEESEADAETVEEQAELAVEVEEVVEAAEEPAAEEQAEEPEAPAEEQEEKEEEAYVSKSEFDALVAKVEAMMSAMETAPEEVEEAELSAINVETVEVDLSAAATPITKTADVVELSEEAVRPAGMSDKDWRWNQNLIKFGLK